MVPGSLGWGTAVLAAMMTLAPSLAAFRAMALPMPRLPPVTKSVRPANFLKHKTRRKDQLANMLTQRKDTCTDSETRLAQTEEGIL